MSRKSLLRKEFEGIAEKHKAIKTELDNLFLQPQPDAEKALKRCKELQSHRASISIQLMNLATEMARGPRYGRGPR
jgi:hypothetical protein